MEQGCNFIAGEAVSGGAAADIRDPATGMVFAESAVASPAEADRAVAAAADAFAAWRRHDGRGDLMRVAADAVEARRVELATLLTREQGKPLAQALLEIDRFVLWFRHYADAAGRPEIRVDDAGRRIAVGRRALGPVLAITPWNFPVSLLAWKLAPALAMGNPVVVKPSPFTPLTTQRVGTIIGPLLPAGVVSVAAGDAALGPHLVAHPSIAKIAFTGSTATGRAIMEHAGPALKRVTLELGGNDAAIVLDDADIPTTAERLVQSAFFNCGQVCVAPKRVFVAQSRLADLIDALAARIADLRVGGGLVAGTTLGPLNNAPQRARVEGLVAAVRAAGGRVVTGGRRLPGPGLFHEPTLVTDVGPEHPVVTEEQFGPILPVLPFASEAEALDLAGRGPYGLGASIWTADPGRAEQFADDLEVGTVWINHHAELRPDAPFGGARASGLGYENGHEVLAEYSRLQVVNTRRP